MYRKFFKRIIDVLIALIGLIMCSPVLLVVIIVLYFANKGSDVFFKQARPGKNEKIFNLIKLRTMTDEKDAAGNLLSVEKRLTKTGRFIRSTSIDEIQQLVNVLKGEMSVIGPRPLLVNYLPLYNKKQARRHEIRPGITGWAQVNGRNAISWEQKFEYDVWYVDNISFLLDMKILLKTIVIILKKEGIDSGSNITMEEFEGNEKFD